MLGEWKKRPESCLRQWPQHSNSIQHQQGDKMETPTTATALVAQPDAQQASPLPYKQAVSIYDNITDSFKAIEQLGGWMANSGMFGCRNKEQGIILAFTAITERRNPADLAREFHIIEGRLTKRSDSALAEFQSKGGTRDWEWKSDLCDSTKASAKVIDAKGHQYAMSYTYEEAEKSGVIYDKSGNNIKTNWYSSAPDMLRARLIMKALRMVEPSIIAGLYSPEEAADFKDEGGTNGKKLFDRPTNGSAPTVDPAPITGKIMEAVVVPDPVVVPPEPLTTPKSPVSAPTSPATSQLPWEDAQTDQSSVVDMRAALMKEFSAESALWDQYVVAKKWVSAGQTFMEISDDRIRDIWTMKPQVLKSFQKFKTDRAAQVAAANGGAR
jgi:hypothetical protein